MQILRSADGKLDRAYVRVAAVYELLKGHKIGRARAMELLAERHTAKQMPSLANTVEQWKRHSLKEMLP